MYQDYFLEQDKMLVVDKAFPLYNGEKPGLPLDYNYNEKYYEFIPFQPVAASSEMVGTSVEELLMHNFPTKRCWECSRLCAFPQEVVFRLNYRSHIKYCLLRAKINRPIEEVYVYIGDGITGGFNDCQYIKYGTAKNVTENGMTIKLDGIGNYIKLYFPRASTKTNEKNNSRNFLIGLGLG